MTKIHGVIPAMVTPATADGLDVDLTASRKLARRLIDAGVHGLFVVSSTGEAPILTREQRRRLIGAIVEENASNVPVIAGVGSPSTAQSITFARDAVAEGVDLVAALPMHSIPVNVDELYGYFAAVADSVPVPTLLYNFPRLTSGQNIPASVAYRLSQSHNVIGIKDSSAVISNALSYNQVCGPDFVTLTGQEDQMLAFLLTGGHGAICAAANVFPEMLVRLYNAATAGDVPLARQLNDHVQAMGALFDYGTFPAGVKSAVEYRTTPVGPPFKPVESITDRQKAVQRIGIERFIANAL